MKVFPARSDDVAKAVTAQIDFEHDLVAAGAKYHDSCKKSFSRPTTGGKICHPQDNTANSKIEEIF